MCHPIPASSDIRSPRFACDIGSRELLPSKGGAAGWILSNVLMLLVQMEHFFKRRHGAIRRGAVCLSKERQHFALPPLIHVAPRHFRPGMLKVFRFEITD